MPTSSSGSTCRSTTMDTLQLSDYAERYIVDRLSTIDGVAQVRIGGQQRYAMRIWLDGDQLAARGLAVSDVEDALTRENVEAAGRPHRIGRRAISRCASRATTRSRRTSRRSRSPRAPTATWCGSATSPASNWPRPSAAPTTAATASRTSASASSRPRPRTASTSRAPRARRRSGSGQTLPQGTHIFVAFDTTTFIDAAVDARLRDPRRGDRAGADRDLAVPRQRARGADSRGHGAGVPDRRVHRAVRVRLLDQPADAARAGAVHRPGRGRRDRRASRTSSAASISASRRWSRPSAARRRSPSR